MPKPLALPPPDAGPSKRPWDVAFVESEVRNEESGLHLMQNAEFVPVISVPLGSRKPVAHALFLPAPSHMDTVAFDLVQCQNETFAFVASSPVKTRHQCKVATPVVESTVRCCTSGSLKRDGYKLVLQELPMPQPRKKNPRATLSSGGEVSF